MTTKSPKPATGRSIKANLKITKATVVAATGKDAGSTGTINSK